MSSLDFLPKINESEDLGATERDITNNDDSENGIIEAAVLSENEGKHGKVNRDGNEKKSTGISRVVEAVKAICSMVLLIFSVVVVMATIFSSQTKLSEEGHPAVAFVAIWALVAWLAMMEGGQGCLVGLQPVELELFERTHALTHKSCALVKSGNNLERFIVGRQFLVVLVVFVINMSGAALPGSSVLGLPDILQEIFVSTGVAMMLMTIVLGQLLAQVVATDSMLDFINTRFMIFTTHIALAIEYSGLLHSVYLVQIVFSKLTGKPIGDDDSEVKTTVLQKLFFGARVLFSVVALTLAFLVTLSALFAGKTNMWSGVPSAVSVVVFFLLMCLVGMMEGMQIALFAVLNMPPEELKNNKMAHKTCQLTFDGNNLQAFLIGRQILVTICMFVVARITSIVVGAEETNVLGASDGLQEFFNTGLLGALITTLVASLAWRIIASSFPVAFLSNPLVYVIIRLCLCVEATGLCSAAWSMARLLTQVGGFQPDETYIGTAQDRLEAKMVQDRRSALQTMGGGRQRSHYNSISFREPSARHMQQASQRFILTDAALPN